MANTILEEKQKFNQPWIRICLVLLIAIFTWGFIQQVVMGIPFGNNPGPDWIFLPIFLLVGGLIIFFSSMKLITKVSKSGISYCFTPFHSKEKLITWDRVKSAKVIDYRPIREYGGWGVRYGLKGKALNVRGKHGIEIEFFSGSNLLIGTQKPEELKNTLKELKESGVIAINN